MGKKRSREADGQGDVTMADPAVDKKDDDDSSDDDEVSLHLAASSRMRFRLTPLFLGAGP